jgi:hypothetical protein
MKKIILIAGALLAASSAFAVEHEAAKCLKDSDDKLSMYVLNDKGHCRDLRLFCIKDNTWSSVGARVAAPKNKVQLCKQPSSLYPVQALWVPIY